MQHPWSLPNIVSLSDHHSDVRHTNDPPYIYQRGHGGPLQHDHLREADPHDFQGLLRHYPEARREVELCHRL